MKKFISLASIFLITACAGREPMPVQTAAGADYDRSCKSLEVEYISNNNSARSKIAANKSSDEGDVALGVVGVVLFWPVLFAMDTKNANGVEGNALLDRNDHLRTIADSKECNVSAWPPAPAKYD
ncbi:MAG: hypothetical protein OEY85_06190 [Rhodospirillales bacterium]|nr:hypothetical protein [Rhodospirillales bacterium]